MLFSSSRFGHMKQKASQAGDTIEVTKDEMKKLFLASGVPEKDLKMQLMISEVSESATLIGDKLYILKKEKKNDKQTD